MIFNLPPSVQLSVCTEPTDMRNYAVPAVMQSGFPTGAVLSSRGRSGGPIATGNSA
jgi:hypothetical protein